MNDKSDVEKLQVLLPHWIEHSHSHQHEFEKWAAAVRRGGHEGLAALLEKAMASMAETDLLLNAALEKAGGPVPGPHKHHT